MQHIIPIVFLLLILGCGGKGSLTSHEASSQASSQSPIEVRRQRSDDTLLELRLAMERGDNRRVSALFSPDHMELDLVQALTRDNLHTLAVLLRDYRYYADHNTHVEYRALNNKDLRNQSIYVFFEADGEARVSLW